MARRARVWRRARTVWGICSLGFVGLASGVAVAHPPDQPAGTLDAGFGNGGIVLTPANQASDGVSVLALDDGKVVTGGATVVGSSPGFTLSRYLPDGALDPAFGTDGTVNTPLTAAPTVAGMVLQPDGKIVAAGTLGAGSDGSQMIVLARYRHDGQLDQTFGTDGLVFTSLGAGSVARAGGIALQRDGRIVVVGLSAASTTSSISLNLLVRYDRDGSLDGTFGVGGLVSVAFNDSSAQILNAVAIADDGKLVVVGNSKQGSTGFNGGVARFHRDGSIDTTFGTGGVVLRQFGGQTVFGSVAVQHDGRILVGGGAPAGGLVARFDRDGTSDASFGVSGLAVSPSLSNIALQVDRCGRIVGAGSPSGTGGGIGLTRLDRNGAPDPTFGTDGLVVTPVDGIILDVTALALSGDDVVVVGNAGSVANPSSSSFLVARYEAGDEHRCECGRGEHGF